MAADIGHFNPFYAIMHQLGSHVNIVYSEHAFLHSFAQYIFEQQYLLGIKTLTYLLYPPNVAKEISPERPITEYHLFHCIQTRVYHFNHLLVRRYILLRHTLHHVRKHIQLRFDNSHINIFLALKIGIKRSPTFFRSEGNIIHRGILNTHFSKQLTGYIH